MANVHATIGAINRAIRFYDIMLKDDISVLTRRELEDDIEHLLRAKQDIEDAEAFRVLIKNRRLQFKEQY